MKNSGKVESKLGGCQKGEIMMKDFGETDFPKLFYFKTHSGIIESCSQIPLKYGLK